MLAQGVKVDFGKTLLRQTHVVGAGTQKRQGVGRVVRQAQERFPKIHFHPLREHAGLALQGA